MHILTTALVVLAIILLVTMIYRALAFLKIGFDIDKWIKTRGIVRLRKVVISKFNEPGSEYILNIEVEYFVNRKKYVCKSIYFDSTPEFMSSVDASKFMINVQSGNSVEIFYNAKKHEESALSLETHKKSHMFLVFGATILIAFAIAFLNQ